MTGNTGVTPERYENLILSVAGIDDPESDTFMRGFAYGRFTKLDSELARHWGVGRGFAVDACPVVDEPVNLLSASSPNHADTGLVERAKLAMLADLRNRKFLEYLFEAEPENRLAYGYIDRPFDLDVQDEILTALATAALASIPDLERMDAMREALAELVREVEQDWDWTPALEKAHQALSGDKA